ncbi:hypothetical protein [Aquimarina longa]|uniref:hypothetical protein n=1 Tax=Aquimarina longa TaxID=1080221 RepID=UPI0007806447|nr:hypothetical protein [Aquimarina longa]
MNAIDKIYSNELGISFFWKQEEHILKPKVQLIFKDIGFLLTLNELKDFSNSCITAINDQCCSQCKNTQCRPLLLKTPSDKIDLAVSKKELHQIQELITGTIFRVELKYWIKNLSLN